MRVPESSIEIMAVIFAIRFVGVEAAFERSSRRGDAIVFRPVLGLRLLFGFGIPLLLWAGAGTMKSGELFDAILGLVAMEFGVAAFLYWPGTILVDPSSVSETRWLGLRRIRFPWNEVLYAGGEIENSVTVG